MVQNASIDSKGGPSKRLKSSDALTTRNVNTEVLPKSSKLQKKKSKQQRDLSGKSNKKHLGTVEEVYQAIRAGRAEEAERRGRKLIACLANNPEVNVAFANALLANNKHALALQHGKRALALSPFHLGARYVIAECHTHIGDYRSAKPILDEILQSTPTSTRAHWLRAFCNLGMFNFKEGWRDYEYGYVVRDKRRLRGIPSLCWRGEKVNSLLITAEQGFGDQILFARFVPFAKEICGGEVYLEVGATLVGLFENLADRVWAITPDGSVPVPFDAHVSIASLPFAMDIDGIDGSRYLAAPPTEIDLKGSKVGFCWKGNPNYPGDSDRSLTLKEAREFNGLAPFAHLQPFGQLPFRAPRVFGPDMAATASIITSLELIVTVDSAVANLAGALGKECWVILPRYGEWRWGLEGDKTPWYDSVTVFRCFNGNREEQLARVKSKLRERYS